MSKGFALVIEDDYDASTIFGKAMEANELDYEVISNGREAMAKLGTASPDIVILDLHLPDVDGAQILGHIRGSERLKETLVVIVSADPRMADMIGADADLVLLKPAPYSQVRDFAARLMMRRNKAAVAAAAPSAPSDGAALRVEMPVLSADAPLAVTAGAIIPVSPTAVQAVEPKAAEFSRLLNATPAKSDALPAAGDTPSAQADQAAAEVEAPPVQADQSIVKAEAPPAPAETPPAPADSTGAKADEDTPKPDEPPAPASRVVL